MHKVQSHPARDYIAGRDGEGRPILMGLLYPFLAAVIFRADGQAEEVRFRHLLCDAPRVHPDGPPIIDDPDFREATDNQVSEWGAELCFREEPIEVACFMFRTFRVGIQECPRYFREFVDSPETFSEDEQREIPNMMEEWTNQHYFVLWWARDYDLDRNGEIT